MNPRKKVTESTSPAAPAVTHWDQLIGHDRIRQWLSSAIRSQRFSGSFLLVGAPGIGKTTVAKLIAKTLLCDSTTPEDMNPCCQCEGCIQVEAETHPDVVRVAKPADRAVIPIRLLIGPEEARMQEGFCRDVRVKPLRGQRKVAILQDADFLNEEGANCLLKTLEEPPAGTVVLVIGTNEQKQLPTIRSRCRILRLGPLSVEDSVKLIRQAHRVNTDEREIRAAVEMSGGNIHAAVRLLTSESDQLRLALTKQLESATPDPIILSRVISTHVNEAGKEAPIRRDAMRDAFSMSLQFYRRQMRQQAADDHVDEATLARLDRSIRALHEVDRNANQASLIECFAADIASGTTGDRGGIA
ncbi:MAG: AAA family ATPase [Planctomycetota bacterium]